MASKQFRIVYNSGLIIDDPSEVASLCVFYDKVLLPTINTGAFRPEFVNYSTAIDDGKVREWERKHYHLFEAGVLERLPPVNKETRAVERSISYNRTELYEARIYGDDVPPDAVLDHFDELNEWEKWARECRLGRFSWGGGCWRADAKQVSDRADAIKVGDEVISRKAFKAWFSSPTKGDFCSTIDCIAFNRNFSELKTHRDYEFIAPQPLPLSSAVFSSMLSMPIQTLRLGSDNLIPPDLALHLTRTDIDLPQIFRTLKGQPVGTDILVALEAKATFRYLLPKIHTYHPDQILEVRAKVADTREGFTMHLQTLSKGLEERAKENASIDEISGFAKRLIETDLYPDYLQFRRQLASKTAGKWEKILDATGKIVEIDAAPWTPKFWGLLLKAIGLSVITTAGEQQEMLTNKYQAFKFMSDIEDPRV